MGGKGWLVMGRLCIFISLCSIFLIFAEPYATAQLCPEPGSGADVVEVFRDACNECDRGPVTTCREDYAITLIDVSRFPASGEIAFTYNVHNTPGTSVERDLIHWVLGPDLEQFQLSLADDKTLSDLFESCTIDGLAPGMDCGLVIPDPTTQLGGVKFEVALGDDESRIFSFMLDETALMNGMEIGEGCVLAATKAGEEDIQRGDLPAPGYVCIAGPVLEEGPSEFICPKSQGYWKNHSTAWPVDSLVLGSQTYSQAELLAILRTPIRGDASLILAKQLVGSKLNIENGSNPDPVKEVIESADELLSAYPGKLPYRIRPFTAAGQQMVEYARILNAYNNKLLTPSCVNEM